MPVSQARLSERSIQYVKGVGPRRLQQLLELGIATVEDACYFPPRRYEDRTRLQPIRDVRPGETVIVRGRLLARGLRRLKRRQSLFEITVGDDSGSLSAVWFNQPYLEQQLQIGEELILYGKVEPGPRPKLIHPELEHLEPDGGEDSLHVGRIVPIYPLVSGIGQRWLRRIIASVLERDGAEVDELLPEPLRRARGWPAAAEAVRELHFPTSLAAMAQARERLAFEELLVFQLALAQRRARTDAQVKPQRYQLDGPLTRGLRQRLPFTLTASQERVLDELLADMCELAPMHRLLQGDVGCGKTVLLAFLVAVAVQSGYQAALMAPTELLAEQHARVLTEWLGPLGVSVGLLAQGVAPAERRVMAADLAAGTLDVAIGTHALIQRGVTFRHLALVLIDEQHKFGVVQRAHLAKKAAAPDVLVVTATPIPRTLALTAYGDLDVSTITELPAGRRPIATRWFSEAQRPALYDLIRRELAQGRQGYVVYPLVEEASTSELRAATQMARRLQQEVFPAFRVGLLHGRRPPKDKERIMRAFAAGELPLLVSTVIVEVGLDVPNATVMVIEHPERFGLAQLHQLRGRIGRGAHPATCALIGDAAEEAVQQRLKAFLATTDGFQLAEADLAQRGPGELLGRRQHGWLPFRIADLVRDRALLEAARRDAEALIQRDPELADPSVAGLRERLARMRRRERA